MIRFNVLSIVFLMAYLAQPGVSICLERLNCRHIKRLGDIVPRMLDGFVDPDKLAAAADYTMKKSRLFQVQKIFLDVVLLGFIVSGFLPILDSYAAGRTGPLLSGLIFFLALGLTFFALELPFDYYRQFVLEEKFGFNRTDLRTWLLDVGKGALLSVALLVILMGPVLWAVTAFPEWWWFWAFVIVAFLQLLLVVLYPVFIAPLFNKFIRLEDLILAELVERLAEKAGLTVKGIYQMDASKRSSHSNAYFTGLGKSKRIVLFDTLMESHTRDEVLAVLAHEIGHWKLKHILKSYLLSLLVMPVGFFLTYLLLNWNALHATFGFNPSQFYIGLFLIAIFGRRCAYFIQPLGLALSRRYERQADLFAADLQGNPVPLATALKRMASHNLANLNPHPAYVLFNYSHPPILERLRALKTHQQESELHPTIID
jgi:STE24 endopeptidase